MQRPSRTKTYSSKSCACSFEMQIGAALPERHLAAVGAIENVALDVVGVLRRTRDAIGGIADERRKVGHGEARDLMPKVPRRSRRARPRSPPPTPASMIRVGCPALRGALDRPAALRQDMPSERPPVTALQLVGTGAFLLALPAGMLAVGGDVRWVRGWLFGAWYVALCATCIGWLRRKDPALLAERYRAPGTGGQSGWDRAVVVGLGLGFFAWLVVMPLDRVRRSAGRRRRRSGPPLQARSCWRFRSSFLSFVRRQHASLAARTHPARANAACGVDGSLRLRAPPHVPGRDVLMFGRRIGLPRARRAVSSWASG